MQGKVEIGGVNTAKLKVLKNEEMVRLMKLAKAGDKQAREAAHCREPAAGAVGDPASLSGRGENRGRPVSGGLHWPYQGH